MGTPQSQQGWPRQSPSFSLHQSLSLSLVVLSCLFIVTKMTQAAVTQRRFRAATQDCSPVKKGRVHYAEAQRRRRIRGKLKIFIIDIPLAIFYREFVYNLLPLNKIALQLYILFYLADKGSNLLDCYFLKSGRHSILLPNVHCYWKSQISLKVKGHILFLCCLVIQSALNSRRNAALV